MNPVFYHKGGSIYDDGEEELPEGWYYWDETWLHYIGPYSTEEYANKMALEYAKSL